MNIKIILQGSPPSTNHVYKIRSMGKFSKIYMTAEGKVIKADYQRQVREQYKGDPLDCKIELSVKLFFSTKHKRDIDNFSKVLLDSLTGIVWVDDSQIHVMHIEKHIEEAPRVELSINNIESMI